MCLCLCVIFGFAAFIYGFNKCRKQGSQIKSKQLLPPLLPKNYVNVHTVILLMFAYIFTGLQTHLMLHPHPQLVHLYEIGQQKIQ